MQRLHHELYTHKIAARKQTMNPCNWRIYALAFCGLRRSVVVHRDFVLSAAAAMAKVFPETLTDSKDLRDSLRDMFRCDQWTSRFTFRENEFSRRI